MSIKPGDTVNIRVHWGGFLPDIRYGVKVVSIDRLLRVTCYEPMWSGGLFWRVPIGSVSTDLKRADRIKQEHVAFD